MKSTHLGIVVGAIVGVVALAYVYQHSGSPEKFGTPSIPFFNNESATSTPKQLQINTPKTSNAPPRYYSLDYNFFLDIPKGFRFSEIQDNGGTVILAEGGNGKSFQIFITPFDEPGPLTPDRIKKDLPQKVILNPHAGTLDGTPALAFTSQDPGTGDVFEIWFVHSGYLYQISTSASFADTMQSFLQSWKFTN